MYYNDDGILIQSLERHRELPVRPNAEQAVKVPLQPLQGSGDSAKRNDNSVSSLFPVFHSFHLILPYFSPLGICAGAQNDGGQRSAHLLTDAQRQQ